MEPRVQVALAPLTPEVVKRSLTDLVGLAHVAFFFKCGSLAKIKYRFLASCEKYEGLVAIGWNQVTAAPSARAVPQPACCLGSRLFPLGRASTGCVRTGTPELVLSW